MEIYRRFENIPEYTTIAFLNDEDSSLFRRKVRNFPKSNVEQLPPHLTILNMIFTTKAPEDVVTAIKDAIKSEAIETISISTYDLIVWHNRKYKGYSIASSINFDKTLIKLRSKIEDNLMPITIPEEKSIWGKYTPHITISLSVDLDAANHTKQLPSIPKMSFVLKELQLLKHGGEFCGYKKIATIKLESPSEEFNM
jgi:2'-5' RNA ligase